MANQPAVSVVIGTYNRIEFLKATIQSLRNELSGVENEIIVVDGGSDDGSTEWLTEQKDIITIVQHNRGEINGRPIERKSWGYFMNLGFRAASAKYICMLSDDCLVVPGAIKKGIDVFDKALKAKQKVGAVAFYWRNWPEQQKYWVGLTWGSRLFVNHGMYLRSALEEINFIDAQSFSFYHADGDLSLRLDDAGYKCIESPDSFIEHFSEANQEVRASNLERQKKDWATYESRWEHLGKPDKDWNEKEYTDRDKTAPRYWGKISSQKGFLRRFKK